MGLNGYRGPLRVAAAHAPPPLTISFGPWPEFLSARDLLVQGDDDTRVVGTLAMNVVPHDFVEAFGTLRARANSNSTGQPELIQSLGDLALGVKGFYPVQPFLSLGGLGRLELLNGVGDLGWSGSATSVHVLGLATLDARVLNPEAIVRAHLNFGYSIENGHNLVGDRPLSAVEQFAGNVTEFDMLNIALAVEVLPEEATPFLEWSLRVPLGARIDTPDVCVGDVPCPSEEGFSSFPHRLTLGVRGDVVPGLQLVGAVDIGLTATIVAGIPPMPTYNLVFGMVYDVGAGTTDRTVPCPEPAAGLAAAPAKPKAAVGRIQGKVVDGSTRRPLPGARVTYPERGFTDQLTGPDGVFESYDLPPGPVRVEVVADGHVPGAFQIPVPEGSVRFSFPLKPATAEAPPAPPKKAPPPPPGPETDPLGTSPPKPPPEPPPPPPPPAFDPLAP